MRSIVTSAFFTQEVWVVSEHAWKRLRKSHRRTRRASEPTEYRRARTAGPKALRGQPTCSVSRLSGVTPEHHWVAAQNSSPYGEKPRWSQRCSSTCRLQEGGDPDLRLSLPPAAFAARVSWRPESGETSPYKDQPGGALGPQMEGALLGLVLLNQGESLPSMEFFQFTHRSYTESTMQLRKLWERDVDLFLLLEWRCYISFLKVGRWSFGKQQTQVG